MSDELTRPDAAEPTADPERTARRQFLRKLSAAGATVPAVSLLLAANFKAASAQGQPYGGGTGCGSS
jgi:hypothetical protein